MPSLDQTGPRGEGAATGGGYGGCGAARERHGFGCGCGRVRFMRGEYTDGNLANEIRALSRQVSELSEKIAPNESTKDEE